MTRADPALGAAQVEFGQVVEGNQRQARAVRGARHAVSYLDGDWHQCDGGVVASAARR